MCVSHGIDAAKHRVGELAYIDGFGGLAKCKVVDLDGKYVRVSVTADGGVYQRGLLIWVLRDYVVPRNRVSTIRGQYSIRNGWEWIPADA